MDSSLPIRIQFSQDSLYVLNICLAVIMFGIALGMEFGDFKSIIRKPRSVAAGVVSQFFLLPLLTFLLVWLLRPSPGIALGMMLVAACPGGNVSNFISSLSGASIALSVSLTALATLLCPVLTPVNFRFWAGILPETSALLQSFAISFPEILQTVLLVLILPLAGGMGLKALSRKAAERIEKPVKYLSFAILIGFIGIALFNNFAAFKAHLAAIFVLVALHNAVAFATGYGFAFLTGLREPERRSVCIETGIQNSGLGLIIIFTFFGGNGEMALIAAWWGVWHIVAGLLLSKYFTHRKSATA